MVEWLRAWNTFAIMKLWRREVASSASTADWLRVTGHVKGHWLRVTWVTGHDEAMEAGGREFDPRPGGTIVG